MNLTRLFRISLIFLIIFLVFLNLSYGDYYEKPVDALKNLKDDELSAKLIIDTVWVQDVPVTLYINSREWITSVKYSSKNILGKKGWRLGIVNAFVSESLERATPEELFPTAHLLSIDDNKKPNKLLYGVTKSPEIYRITVLGKKPFLKSFNLNGETYTLWYLIGSNELDKAYNGNVGSYELLPKID